MSGKRFTDLTRKEHGAIFDALGLPWKDYKEGDDGWINMKGIEGLSYPLSVNIENGNYSYFEYEYEGGNIVDLVMLVIGGSAEGAIREINKILNRSATQVEKPTLPEGYGFADDYLPNPGEDNGRYYVRTPVNILYNKNLSPIARLVWEAIFERCGNGKKYSFAKQQKLADDLGVRRETVCSAIEELVKNKLILETKRGRGRNRFPVCSD